MHDGSVGSGDLVTRQHRDESREPVACKEPVVDVSRVEHALRSAIASSRAPPAAGDGLGRARRHEGAQACRRCRRHLRRGTSRGLGSGGPLQSRSCARCLCEQIIDAGFRESPVVRGFSTPVVPFIRGVAPGHPTAHLDVTTVVGLAHADRDASAGGELGFESKRRDVRRPQPPRRVCGGVCGVAAIIRLARGIQGDARPDRRGMSGLARELRPETMPALRDRDGDGGTPPLVGLREHPSTRSIDEGVDSGDAEPALRLLSDQVVRGEATLGRGIRVKEPARDERVEAVDLEEPGRHGRLEMREAADAGEALEIFCGHLGHVPFERDGESTMRGDRAERLQRIATNSRVRDGVQDETSQECPGAVGAPHERRAGGAVEEPGSGEHVDESERILVVQFGEIDASRQSLDPEVPQAATRSARVVGRLDIPRTGGAMSENSGQSPSGHGPGDRPRRVRVEQLDVVDDEHAVHDRVVVRGCPQHPERGVGGGVDRAERLLRESRCGVQDDGSTPEARDLRGDPAQEMASAASAGTRHDQ